MTNTSSNSKIILLATIAITVMFFGVSASAVVGDPCAGLPHDQWLACRGPYVGPENAPTPRLTGSCLASPSSVNVGGSITWTATGSGQHGPYLYSWTGTDGLSGDASSITQTYSTPGTKTASVRIRSGGQNIGQNFTANCSAIVVVAPTANLVTSCSAVPGSIQTGDSSTFIANASGGIGSYTYNWSGACSGSGLTCSNIFNTPGTQSAIVTVTSGSQTSNAVCSVSIVQNTPSCTSNYQQRCNGNNLYWYDSCGALGNLIQYCANGCSGNTCQNINTCTYHSYQRCNDNNLYWYDSCGTQQNIAQYCSNGCSNNLCSNNYNPNVPYGNCTSHAYKLCVGSAVYWYNSCGVQQDLYTSCGGNQTCQYGQCTNYINPVLPPVYNYATHYTTACYANSIYWYDSLGTRSGLYRSCNDSNACTQDSCSANTCIHTAIANCPANQPAPIPVPNCGNGLCETTLGETNTNCQADCKISATSALAVSFFVKQDINATQWQKTAQVNSNGKIYFMIAITNSSTAQVDNATISTNIPSEISSLGNLQLNGVPVSGDIVSGIAIGSIAPSTTKTITFEGLTQTISSSSTQNATATSNVLGVTQSDTISITANPGQVAGAAVSAAGETSGFWEFLKRWYIWILGVLVLIFLFVIVFKRLSSEA